MISPISFQGTYKVYNREYDGIIDFFELMNRCESQGMRTKLEFTDDTKKSQIPVVDGQEVTSTATIVSPDEYDNRIEAFCKYAGIKFTKLNQDELLDPNNIIKRTVKPERTNDSIKIVLADVEKLDKLVQKQTVGNYSHVEKDYNRYFKNDADFNLKSGEDIVAPTLVFNPNMAGGIRGAIEYVEKFGADSLNDDSLFVDFVQMTNEPDHCMYFAMKNIGMKKIPVCVDERTRELGEKMGLFE